MKVAFPLLAAALVAAAPAKGPAVTSAYTHLDLAKCRKLAQDEVGQSASWRCPGYRGVPLFVELGDERFDLDAGQPDHDGFWSSTFDEQPTTIEWRLNKDKPFAFIYRLRVANPDVPKTSRLIVESVGDVTDPDRFGCRIAEIDGAAPQANERARAAADRLLTGDAICMEG